MAQSLDDITPPPPVAPPPNEATASRSPRAVRLWPWILGLLVLVCVAYVLDPDAPGLAGGALRSDFAFDDLHLIAENSRLDRPAGALDGFTGDYYASSQTAPSGEARALGYYRPLAVMSNWLDVQLWDRRPFGFHLTNLFLHAGVVIAFFLFLRRLYGRLDVAAAAAALFAVHPVHTESVTFISGRVDVLAALFGVVSLLAYTEARRETHPARARRWLAGSLATFFLALLSKEMAITFPAAVFLVDRVLAPRADWKRSVRAVVPFAAVIVVYLALRWMALGTLGSEASAGASSSGRAVRVAYVVATYLGLLLWPPFRFNVEPMPLVPAGFTPSIAGFALVTIAIATLALWPAVRRRLPLVSFGLLWMLAALVPVSHVLPVETLIGERYLYVPSLGATLALAAVLLAIATRLFGSGRAPRAAFAASVGIIALAYLANTVHRNTYWKSNLTFWKAKTELTPRSSEPWSALGLEYLKVGDLAQARVALEQSLAIDPRHLEALNNYALLLLEQGQPQEAIKMGARAIGIDPEYAEALNTLGTAFHMLGRFPEAVGQYKRALRARPAHRGTWVNLANSYLTAGVPDSAISAFRRALALGPDRDLELQVATCHALAGRPEEGLRYLTERGVVKAGSAEALLLAGTLYASAGQPEIARTTFLRATMEHPDYVPAWVELGQTLASLGRREEARGAFETAVRLDPAASIAHNNLGVLAEEARRFDEALGHYQRALAIVPDDPAVLRNAGGVLVELGRYEEARPLLDRAAAARDPLALFYRARLFQALGSFDEAMADYRLVLMMRPTFAPAHRLLGLLQLEAGDLAGAATSLRMFLAWAPPDDADRPEIERLVATLPEPNSL